MYEGEVCVSKCFFAVLAGVGRIREVEKCYSRFCDKLVSTSIDVKLLEEYSNELPKYFNAPTAAGACSVV